MSTSKESDRFETRAIHAGQEPDPQNGAVMTPVYFTSTFEQDAPAKPRQGYEYSRTTNPTRVALEANIAALEGGAWGLCYASGLAATNAICDRLEPGDHVVAANDLYGGTYRLFMRVFARYGIEFTFVDDKKPGDDDEDEFMFEDDDDESSDDEEDALTLHGTIMLAISKSALMSAFPPALPQPTPKFDETCVNRFTSTPSNTPSRTK